jgi:hypothetical protein
MVAERERDRQRDRETERERERERLHAFAYMHVGACEGPEQDIGSPEARVTGSCKPRYMDAGN